MNVHTRSVEKADSDFLFRLKNDASTRRFAITTHDKIKREAHDKWLAMTLRNKRVYYFMILFNGLHRCGTIRFDHAGNTAEVAIHISRNFRGRGVGTYVLGMIGSALMHSLKCDLKARIVDSNMRSMIVFLKNGFTLKEHKDGVSFLEKRYHAQMFCCPH